MNEAQKAGLIEDHFPERKVIQVSTVIDSVGKYLVLALCNDGTLWQLDGLYEAKWEWEQVPTPPT